MFAFLAESPPATGSLRESDDRGMPPVGPAEAGVFSCGHHAQRRSLRVAVKECEMRHGVGHDASDTDTDTGGLPLPGAARAEDLFQYFLQCAAIGLTRDTRNKSRVDCDVLASGDGTECGEGPSSSRPETPNGDPGSRKAGKFRRR